MKKDNHKELICSVFKQASRDIWGGYGESFEAGITFGEETITETTLMGLTRKMPQTIISRNFQTALKPFNRNEERKIGADWEWYIIEGDRWTKLLVQAKKLIIKDNLNNYSLHHEYKDGSNQCQNLIYNAWANEFIPIYCFYNFLEPEIYTSVIPDSNPSFPTDYELLGWTYCYADHLFPTKNGKKDKFKDVYKNCFTVSRLFCGNLSIDDILREYNDLNNRGNGGGLKVPFPPDDSGPGGGSELSKGTIKSKHVSELPEYVKIMLNSSGVTIKEIGDVPVSNCIPNLSPLVVATVRVPVDEDSGQKKNNQLGTGESELPYSSNKEELHENLDPETSVDKICKINIEAEVCY
ncbi:hypothetical protein P4T29_15905 [Bacillus mobilis]|uniref:DUF6615 family protein n=1 Tax=Bacillus mobilis TaxID=2026190 RepID=UPI002E237F3B|nr:hypothetical protein [Bacillus mobilis]